MRSFFFVLRFIYLPLLALCMLCIPSGSQGAPLHAIQAQQTAFTCSNDTRPVSSEAELSGAQKNTAFHEVVTSADSYEDYCARCG
jgi:hypothetical protein